MNAKEARRRGIPEPREITGMSMASRPWTADSALVTSMRFFPRWQGKDGRSYDTKAAARDTFVEALGFDEDHTVGESTRSVKRSHRAEGRNWVD